MTPGSQEDERSTLEDRFFADPRAELRERLREAGKNRTRQMESLADVSGIEDIEVLEKLVLLGIQSETLAVLTLYPLVAVAWADGTVDRHERDAVLRSATECGMAPGSVAHDLVASWLEEPPGSLLRQAWQEYTQQLTARVSPEWRVVFGRELLARAHAVADASGGFLALDKTSSVERRVLDDLRSVFE